MAPHDLEVLLKMIVEEENIVASHKRVDNESHCDTIPKSPYSELLHVLLEQDRVRHRVSVLLHVPRLEHGEDLQGLREHGAEGSGGTAAAESHEAARPKVFPRPVVDPRAGVEAHAEGSKLSSKRR